MILYNPFKPHIVEFEDGMFGIRRLTLKGYNFLDLTLKLEYWYSKAGFLCKTHNTDKISKKMAELIMNKPTFKVKRVIDYDC